MINNYKQAVEYLLDLQVFSPTPGLQRMRAILGALDNPHECYKIIHVAGSNGKGSVIAMLTAALQHSGLAVGRYTSPHLLSYCERWHFAGDNVDEQNFARNIAKVAAVSERLQATSMEKPTTFEVLTAGFFNWLAECKAEYAVVETGLGGLLDSTNVVQPIATIITNIGWDHVERCGPQLSDIARHKAGIIKREVPVFTAVKEPELTIIERQAHDNAAQCWCLGRDWQAEDDGIIGDVRQLTITGLPYDAYNGQYKLSLLAAYQVDNAALAIAVYSWLTLKDIRLNCACLRSGIAHTEWYGRFSWLPTKPPLLVDGAHNTEGMSALRASLDEMFPVARRLFVIGVVADKPAEKMLNILLRPDDSVICVKPPNERGLRAVDLARLCNVAKKVNIADDLPQAIVMAKMKAGENSLVILAGSLYLLGEFRELWLTDCS